MKSGIYRIDCTANGRFYIGSAKSIKARWKAHINALKRGDHGNSHLLRIARKHGLESLQFSIIEECPCECLLSREQFYLDTLKPTINLSPTAGSITGSRRTEAQKMRSVQGQPSRPIHQINAATGDIVATFTSARAATRATGISNCTIGQVCIGAAQTAGGYFWCYVDTWDESKYIKRTPASTGKVLGIDLDGNEVEYASTRHAADVLSLNIDMIRVVAQGMRKSYKGYQFSYIDRPKRPLNFRKRTPVLAIKDGASTVYNSLKQASKGTRICSTNILQVCDGARPSHNGYIFRYLDSGA